MDLMEKSDDEVIKIASPIWSNLVKSSNIKDYGGFTKDFSSQMLYGPTKLNLENSGQVINFLQAYLRNKKFWGVFGGISLLPYSISKRATH